MFFRAIVDEGLAQRAYLIGCRRSGQAVLVDPERDVDRYLAVARREGLRIAAVAETHIHADFLSGARELVEEHGCTAYLSAEGGPEWQYDWARGRDRVALLRDGDRFGAGGVRLEAVHTPGHTPEHLCFLLTDEGAGVRDPMGILSGDFAFVGDLGRPDLLESALGQPGLMEPAARRLHRSATRLLGLPEYLRIWPGHGAGSACGKALGEAPDTTLGYEIRSSPALAAARRGPDAFVSYVLEGQPEPPPYFGRMKTENKRGPAILGSLPEPPRLSADALLAASRDGRTAIVDARADRTRYYAAHFAGSVYAPLDNSFCTVVGSYVPASAPVALICREEQVEEAVRRLVRIGLDRAAGWAPPETVAAAGAQGGELARVPAVTFRELASRPPGDDYQLLDVRRRTEHEDRSVAGSINVPHTQLGGRLSELPRDREVVVHCLSGGRASAAASLLEREGFRVSVVNDVLVNAFR